MNIYHKNGTIYFESDQTKIQIIPEEEEVKQYLLAIKMQRVADIVDMIEKDKLCYCSIPEHLNKETRMRLFLSHEGCYVEFGKEIFTIHCDIKTEDIVKIIQALQDFLKFNFDIQSAKKKKELQALFN